MPKKINWQLILDHKIVAGLIVLIIASLFNSLFGGWNAIFSCIKFIWGILIYTLPIPLWLLAILIIVSLGSLIIFLIAWIQTILVPWREYTEDLFDGMIWRWVHLKNNPIKPWPYCPIDNTMLSCIQNQRLDKPTTSYICETCNRKWGPFEGHIDYNQGRICRYIDRKIRNEEWKQVVENKRKSTT
jgi:hypothetical protein